MSKKLLNKLEKYEQQAYSGGYGVDWLEQVGEGFKVYIRKCVEDNIRRTIEGFERYIDKLAGK